MEEKTDIPPPAYDQQGQQPAYPPQGQGQAYPPQGQGQAYPPQGQGQAYPPQGQGQAYPPQGQGQAYPPQGQAYPPQGYPQAQQNAVVINQPLPAITTTTVIRTGLRNVPCQMQCPNCQNQVTTLTYKEVGLLVWLLVGGAIILGLWFGCCLIPFCIDDVKDTVHTCPVCKYTIGKHAALN